jgi:uncharacterized membrane protein YbhN (UPF0104 family)
VKDKRWWPRLRVLSAATVVSFAAWLAWRALRHYSLAEITSSLAAIGLADVATALALTAASFVCLSCNDALALRYAGRRLPYRRIALASFTSISIGHVIGLALLSSGALRYRFYRGWGLGRGDVARMLVFCGTTIAVGITGAAGIAALARPALVGDLFRVGTAHAVAAGMACLAAVGAYLALAALARGSLRLRGFQLHMPPFALALGQVAVGTADQLLVAAALHRMLAAATDVGFVPVAAAYAAANAAAIVAHVPGGLGVIEAVVVSLLPGAQVLGAVLAFRAVYFLAPFPLGCAVLAATEVARRRSASTRRRP